MITALKVKIQTFHTYFLQIFYKFTVFSSLIQAAIFNFQTANLSKPVANASFL